MLGQNEIVDLDIYNGIENTKVEHFKFEEEFKECLEMSVYPNKTDGASTYNIMDIAVSFDPPITESEHIVNKAGYGMIIDTKGNVLLGKMSFQMMEDTFNKNWFHLVPDEKSSPKTGIKINLDAEECIENEEAFKFGDQTASHDAKLKDLIVSRDIENEENPEEVQKKVYELTPEFNEDTKEYEVTLLEYIDTLDIEAILKDESSSMLIKVPKRNEETGELIYKDDGSGGQVIDYEEKEMLNNTPLAVTINKLGEPDTEILVIVTAEDRKN